MESINEFYKGLDMDTDPHKVPPGTIRDASNIRIVNNEGHGLVVVNINGNEFRFQLKNGYSPLGYCVYNSIAYIFSTNGTNGEIGCYPAPNGTGSFPKDVNNNPTYRALQNWTGNAQFPTNPRSDFNTPLLNFDTKHQIQAVPRIDYDNSVNLYFTDNKNQLRCINTGFDQTGTYISTERLYWIGNFNQINVFGESSSPPIINTTTLSSGGSLQCGNYFFFIRYSTSSLNKTSFLGQSFAVQISLGAVNDMSIDGAPGGTVSTNEAILNITNIDNSYAFMEIAVVYYNQGTSSVYLIDNEYNITGSSMTIVINGDEDQLAFTMAQIQQGPPSYNICKSIAQLEDRLWGGNWRESNALTPDMISFANSIKIGYDASLQIPDAPFQQSYTFAQSGQYKNYKNTYNEVGYFRGETYPFAIVYVFTDGTESEAIPCNGFDDFNLTHNRSNTNGIYRFPSNQYAAFLSTTDSSGSQGNNLLNVLGVTFNWTGLTIPSGVVGWYFVRGERKQNLIYQGITVPTAKAIPINCTNCNIPVNAIPNGTFPTPLILPLGYTHIQNGYAPGTYYIPVFDSYVPFLWSQDPVTGSSGTYNLVFNFPESATIYNVIGDHMGFYSPDHFFIGTFNDQAYTVHTIGTVHMFPYSLDTLIQQSGYNAANQMFETLYIEFGTARSNSIQCDNIPGFTPGGNHDNFTSMFTDGDSTDSNCFFYYKDSNITHNNEVLTNRAFQTNRYIGMLAPTGALPYNIAQGQNVPINFDQFYSLANVYQDDPNPLTYNITTLYNPANVLYEQISKFIPSSSTPTKQTFYSGDCFLQRTYIKQMYTPDHVDSDACVGTLDGGVSCAAGIIFSVITENNINTAMRVQDLQNFYYPKTGLNSGLGDRTFFAMASDNNDPESDILNTGYDQTLSGITYEGFDINLPFQETQFPTRIAYSEFHPNGSFTDYYKIFDLAAYQDYDYRLGQINFIAAFHSRLISVQDSGINFHLVNERALQNSSSAGDILIGSGTVLDAKAQPLSDVYGSEHQWSIVQTDYNIYGVDYNKRKIWRIKPNGEYENISDTKYITAWITSVFIPLSNPESTIVNTIPDNPISLGGIVAGYNRKYGDVIFTVILQQPNKSISGGIQASNEYEFIIPPSNLITTINITFDFPSGTITGSFAYNNNLTDYVAYLISLIISTGLYTVSYVGLAGEAGTAGLLLISGICYSQNNFQILELDTSYSGNESIGGGSLEWNIDLVGGVNPPGWNGNCTQYYSDSMCFSEKMDEFTNRPQYNSPFYVSLNNDFFSINPGIDTALPNNSVQQNFYVHDIAVTIGGANNLQTFYSTLQKSFISYIHNEHSDYEKIYSNLKLNSNGNEFSNIIFTTEEQISNNLTFRQPNALWIDPRFRENLWMVSVPRATTVLTTANNPDKVLSVMRGKYMKVYVEFNKSVQQYWKSIKTYFRISY